MTKGIRLALLGLVCACGAGRRPADPSACEALSDAAARDECLAGIATEVFRRSADEGAALARRIEDPLVRDFVYLTVTREVDPGSPRWCDLIEQRTLAERCRVLVSRPHLHRELVEGSKPPPRAPPRHPERPPAPPDGAPR